MKMLLATDGSRNSLRIADYVTKLAGEGLGLDITVIIVMPFTKDMAEFMGMQSDNYQDALEYRIKPIFEKYKRAFEGFSNIQLDFLVKQGEVAEKILEVANTGHYDQLLVGSRGLSAVKEIFIGSVSHKIIQLSKVPVLVVK